MRHPRDPFSMLPGSALRHTLAAMCAGLLLPAAAQAADVDLVTNIEPANSIQAQTYVPYDVRVRFANIVGTASNAMGSIVLPAQLSNVQLKANAANGTYCQPASSFTPVPTSTTTGGETMSARFVSLSVGQTCEYTLTVTPMTAGTAYPMKSTMQVSSGDTELRPDTNTSENPFALTNVAVALEMQKRITSAATLQPNGDYLVADPNKVDFEVRYKNNSTVALSLGGTNSQWIDWEGPYSAQVLPATGSFTRGACSSSLTGTSSSICKAINFIADGPSNPATGVYLFQSNFGSEVIQPGEEIVISYSRSFGLPSCGDAKIGNTSSWNLSNSNVAPQWTTNTADNTAQNGNARVVFLVRNPATPTCLEENLGWSGTKTLQSINGNKATYAISLNVPDVAVANPVMRFRVYDLIKLANGIIPMSSPNGSAVMSMRWTSCQKTSATQTQDCLGSITNADVQIDKPNFTPASFIELPMTTGTHVNLTLELEFKTLPSFQCMQQTDALQNSASFTVLKLNPSDPYVYTPDYAQVDEPTLVPILANSPFCVNLAVNKSVSPMLVKSPTDLITTKLTFRNNSSAYGPKSVSAVTGTNLLGSTFQIQSASCTTVSGKATVPAGSLVGNVTTSNNLFSVPITDMESGAVVECILTGYQTQAGSYNNPATIALASPTGKLADGTSVTVKDVLSPDNSAAVNYMAAGVQVTLTKTVSPTTAVKPGATLTYTVTAANTLTDTANGTVLRDTLPASMSNYSWICTASGGASCPNAASGSGGKGGAAINEKIAIFPPGAQVVYTITGTLNADATDTSISNTAFVDLPNSFASCGPDNTTGPCQATVTNPIITSATGTTPAPVPSNTPWGLALLVALIGGLAWCQQRALRH